MSKPFLQSDTMNSSYINNVQSLFKVKIYFIKDFLSLLRVTNVVLQRCLDKLLSTKALITEYLFFNHYLILLSLLVASRSPPTGELHQHLSFMVFYLQLSPVQTCLLLETTDSINAEMNRYKQILYPNTKKHIVSPT